MLNMAQIFQVAFPEFQLIPFDRTDANRGRLVDMFHAWCNAPTDVPRRLFPCFWEQWLFHLCFICASCFWGSVTRLSCSCVYHSLHSLRLDFEMNKILVIWELLCWMKLIYRGLEWLAWGLGPQNTQLSTVLLAKRFHVRSFREANLTWDWNKS